MVLGDYTRQAVKCNRSEAANHLHKSASSGIKSSLCERELKQTPFGNSGKVGCRINRSELGKTNPPARLAKSLANSVGNMIWQSRFSTQHPSKL
jgi:hypothetical protein